MPDARFFKPEGPFRLDALGRLAGAELDPPEAGEMVIRAVAPLDQASPDDISFIDNPKYLGVLGETRAGAVIVAPKLRDRVPARSHRMISETPYKAYALVAQAFYPYRAAPEPGVHPEAVVAADAAIGGGCQIDAGAVIGAGVTIGPESRIGANSVVGDGVVIGTGSAVGANVTLQFCIIGDGVIIHPGVRVGQDGFGFAQDPAGHVKVPQVGRVIIEDRVEIGANTTIDRGAGPDTVIGPGCMIDNLVQIGHNVNVGKGCVIVSQVGISGSTKLGDFVVLAGQAGVAGHLDIGTGAIVAAKGGVTKNLSGGRAYGGYPAVPIDIWRRQVAAVAGLAKRRAGRSRRQGGEGDG